MRRDKSARSLSQQQQLLEWTQRVADCRQSGMTVKHWCEENGITLRNYYFWQKRVFSLMVEQQRIQLETEEQENRFVEVPVAHREKQASGLAVSIDTGRASVRIYSGADPVVVRAAIGALPLC